MLRKLLLLLFCGVLVGLFSLNGFDSNYDIALADAALGDGTQPINYGGLSTQRPLPKNETVFVTDVGGDLDKYLYRDDLQTTNGCLLFEIDI